MHRVRFFVASLLLAACSGSSTPATAPTFVPTTAPTTTTTFEVTTTLDRVAEIEAIYQDLEERRLDALYRGDRQAFAALFAVESYMEASLDAFEILEFIAEPEPPVVRALEVLRDDSVCLAVRFHVDGTQALGPEAVGEVVTVLQRNSDGNWGYSYTGEGWLCEEPHPLS